MHFLYPSTLIVSKEPVLINTILGSCVAVCLFDPFMKIGGMNHYMLPYWNGEGLASPKYGNIAIEKLIDKMLQEGSIMSNLTAKVFGGGNIYQIKNYAYNIHERNILIAKSILTEYKIPVVGSCVGGTNGRNIKFHTESGKVMHRYILKTNSIP